MKRKIVLSVVLVGLALGVWWQQVAARPGAATNPPVYALAHASVSGARLTGSGFAMQTAAGRADAGQLTGTGGYVLYGGVFAPEHWWLFLPLVRR